MNEPCLNPELKAQVETAPKDPGIYRFRDRDGRVLYIGKAKSLRNRVRSYFRVGGDGRFLIHQLQKEIHSVEFIVTATEKEALLLENTLIKRDRPSFNINLRDDKSFVSLRLDPDAEIPRLSVVRKVRDDGALYFGPFSSASAVRATVKFIGKHFGIRPCSDGFFKAHSRRPCLKYQIGRCRAPCCGLISLPEHRRLADQVSMFLQGKSKELVRDLDRRMRKAAVELEFERAASLRDQVTAIRKTIEGQIVTRTVSDDIDVVGFHREKNRVEIAMLFIRKRSLVSSLTHSFQTKLGDAEVLASFLSQYYAQGNPVPESVVIPIEVPDTDMLESLLGERRGKRIPVVVAKRGEKKRLLGLAEVNAQASYRTRARLENEMAETLANLAKTFELPRIPRRIECFDISTLMGKETVASMVVFVSGRPEPSEYRRFQISESSGQDDFASMTEVVRRRYARLLDEGGKLPDLVVIDGGKGQLSAALESLVDLGIDQTLPIVGLAKARTLRGGSEPSRSDERVFLPGRTLPITLDQESQENFLLVRIRDEAHRFAITYHRSLRSRRVVRSDLDSIRGIGPERKRQLLVEFGSLAAIRQATAEDLSRVPGISLRGAREILSELARLAGQEDPMRGGEIDGETT